MSKKPISKYEVDLDDVDVDRALHAERVKKSKSLYVLATALSGMFLVPSMCMYIVFNEVNVRFIEYKFIALSNIILTIVVVLLFSIFVYGIVSQLKSNILINIMFFDDYFVVYSRQFSTNLIAKTKSRMYIKCKYTQVEGFILQNYTYVGDSLSLTVPSSRTTSFSRISSSSSITVVRNRKILNRGLKRYLEKFPQMLYNDNPFYKIHRSGRLILCLEGEKHQISIKYIELVRELANKFMPDKNKTKLWIYLADDVDQSYHPDMQV